jgi:hypothetical protein
MKQKPTPRTEKAPVISQRSVSCAGGRRPKAQEPKSDKPEKGKTVYDDEWSVSSDAECCENDSEAKPALSLSKKKARPTKDAAPAAAVASVSSDSECSENDSEAKPTIPKKASSTKDAAPAAAVEAVTAKDAAPDTVESVGDKDIAERSPSPPKLERDFVPSSISPVNAPVNASPKHTVYGCESLQCNETMPEPKMSAGPSVTWHTPLVWPTDGPPSKRPKTSREGTPKTPEN